ncbi:hypothetical protein BDM02DRAFT_3086927 [Thelephora ganbajun]|uniref:Uncharacterized protein n=1 Tax=Thelephora ganbajun TaxID=370292 RepID=A0ACB6ZWH0_THEGA|nr:hypothetical protein BDM02DRAFT_3086927 [Thelephora ganbajun]
MTNHNLTLAVPRLSSLPQPEVSSVLVSHQNLAQLPPNHVLIRVDRFGFTANNISYQALGEVPHFRYFDFHPAPDAGGVSSKTHGLFPVWGFGDIVVSNHPIAKAGERVYGYFAPARYLVLEFSTDDLNSFFYYVPRPHLPPDRRPYNQVIRCAADAQYDSDPLAEDLTMLYRPLYWTSFWCEDWLFASNYRGGAKLIFISSASSKTAFCLAYCVQTRIRNEEIPGDTRIIGLTSKRNMGFTRRLGLYHEVVSYDNINEKSFDPGVRAVYADVAGSDELNKKLLAIRGPIFVATIKLGMSNVTPTKLDVTNVWTKNTTLEETTGGSSSTKALKFETFFMVEWLAVRVKQLSVKEIVDMQIKAWKRLLVDAKSWVEITRVYGGEKVKEAYDSALKNGLRAEDGYVWSLWDEQTDVIKGSAKCKL